MLFAVPVESGEAAPQSKLKEEQLDSFEAEPHIPSPITLSAFMDHTAAPSPSPPVERASPPSSSLPLMPVAIKQEPQSPVYVSSEPDAVDNITHLAHSTTAELQVAPAAAALPGSIIKCM